MKIVVTGAAGFIGAAVVRDLVRRPEVDAVVAVDALTYAANPLTVEALSRLPGVTFVQADVRDRGAMARLFETYAPAGVMHLAAETHVDRSIDDPRLAIDTNVGGTLTLLEAARAYWSELPSAARAAFRFLHVSTDEVYGSLGETGQFREEDAYAPNSPYSASKAAADHLARAWHRTYGLPVMISNCSNNYGPYQFPEKLIPLMVLNALDGKPLPLYGHGTNVRDWLFVEDHADALWHILIRGRVGEKYNVGGGAERTNIDVVRRLCAILDDLVPGNAPHGRLITFVADRPGHDQRYAIDARKIERDLGWRPVTSFEDGLRATVAWYLDNRAWWEPLRAGVYDGCRLGLAAMA